MLTNCSVCSISPNEEHLKIISKIPGNRVCLCIACGSYWQNSSYGWELLLPSYEKGEPQKDENLSSARRETAIFRLVKDFKNYQFLYYWLDCDANKVSSEMTTLHHAEEWIIDYHFSLYDGKDRRKSKIDRRKMGSSKLLNGKARFFSKRESGVHGRRITDRQVQVDIDLSVEKLNFLKQAIKQRSINSSSAQNQGGGGKDDGTGKLTVVA